MLHKQPKFDNRYESEKSHFMSSFSVFFLHSVEENKLSPLPHICALNFSCLNAQTLSGNAFLGRAGTLHHRGGLSWSLSLSVSRLPNEFEDRSKSISYSGEHEQHESLHKQVKVSALGESLRQTRTENEMPEQADVSAHTIHVQLTCNL